MACMFLTNVAGELQCDSINDMERYRDTEEILGHDLRLRLHLGPHIPSLRTRTRSA